MSFMLLGILNAQAAGGGGGAAFDLLETTTLTSNAGSVDFTGLGSYSDYKHLQLRILARAISYTFTDLNLRFNNDSGSNYSRHRLRGTGSAVNSEATWNQTYMPIGNAADTSTSNAFYAIILDVLDFSSTTKNTTTKALTGYTADGYDDVRLAGGLWNNTNAVTSINLTADSTSFQTGSRFSLYGVK